jgi:acetoin utilization deacetylase AcuC-like enzyme
MTDKVTGLKNMAICPAASVAKGEPMKVIFHPAFYEVYTSDPAAAAGRMEAVVQAIEDRASFVEAEPASREAIAAVHSDRHIESVRRRGLYDIAALAAGGAVQAAEIGLNEPAFGLIRPPGHHASSDSSWGFCYFNNMAVALTALKRSGRIGTAYVLDVDLHYGDGNVDTLARREWVTVYNPSAYERETYLAEVVREMEGCDADIIAVSAGFDNHRADWGGVMATEDYRSIGRAVRDAARRNRGGCFAILEGGYNHNVLGDNVLALIRGLAGEDP